MVFLYMVAEYTRRAQLKPEPVHFALEQPASPRAYQPEVVSFWDTSEWKGIQKEFNLREVTFNQGSLGGLAMKPTTLGTTFDLCMDDFSMPSQQPERNVSSSKQLERWAPGLMNAVSSSPVKDVFKQPVKLKTLSWEEHVNSPLSILPLTEKIDAHKLEFWLWTLVDLFFQQVTLAVGSVDISLLDHTRSWFRKAPKRCSLFLKNLMRS